MSATPEQMGDYFGSYPVPPTKPGPGASQAEWEAYYHQKAQWEDAKDDYEAANGPPPSPAPVVPPASPGGGLPAARMGDMTAHGGVIVEGVPTVMIGYMPAAVVSKNHTCPMVSGVVPHVGGPILPPGSPTVLIGYMPAARMSDQATCAGGPDVIAQGEMTVLIG